MPIKPLSKGCRCFFYCSYTVTQAAANFRVHRLPNIAATAKNPKRFSIFIGSLLTLVAVGNLYPSFITPFPSRINMSLIQFHNTKIQALEKTRLKKVIYLKIKMRHLYLIYLHSVHIFGPTINNKKGCEI